MQPITVRYDLAWPEVGYAGADDPRKVAAAGRLAFAAVGFTAATLFSALTVWRWRRSRQR